MDRTIVIGYDGSDHAPDALALGRLLGRLADAELLVVCAYPEDPLGESPTAAELAGGLREDAEAHLLRARETLDGDGGRAELRALAGASPSQVLHELAEEVGAVAIVVGATHHGTRLRLLSANTPAHVLDHAPCPVAVAPEGFAAQAHAPQRIAVAYDDTPESERALAVAAGFARRAHARLRLVTVINAAAVGLYPPLDAGAYEQVAALARERAHERLDAAIGRLEGVEAEGVVLDGDPGDELVADSAADDLLFTGSHGKGPLRRVLLGSTSGHLLREAACPLVVVPRGED